MPIPVGGRVSDGPSQLAPSHDLSSLEGERPEDLPLRFDPIKVRGALGREDKLPPGMGQGEQKHVHRPVDVEVVEDP